MRSAGAAPANSAVAERKPDRAFGFPEGVAAGLDPLALRSNIRLVSALITRGKGGLRSLSSMP
jgi:hypothetical protein